MAMELFVEQNGEISGPFSPQELKIMARDHEISKNDFIRKTRDGKPVKAAHVKGLFAEPTTEPASASKIVSSPAATKEETPLGLKVVPREPEPNSAQPPNQIGLAILVVIGLLVALGVWHVADGVQKVGQENRRRAEREDAEFKRNWEYENSKPLNKDLKTIYDAEVKSLPAGTRVPSFGEFRDDVKRRVGK
ncbi:hypothetical protein [Schlesneria paludicola]|uniref:hypothetical protein n=1 Tax=Schlesneria paludicola TaxID=360056 RepID=UPI00029A0E54|nr:hypothetical protein [Schlesneria paludicola]